ncbi:hypothetical protein [Tropicibacter oceani]|uniref:Uncharacterized protein n=1 Tax=Tropicibacter oceani TaxID=3058420 RepID=A0ABY8QN90_9RHOB|nr:hypothetical protein [Tropicibacter oceani]WGW05582.1 hypothetical protein QF118_08550 [Tropicibacter oceani]
MITLEDVQGMTCLSREEIEAVAEHEGIPDLDAACLADYMMHEHHGPAKVQQMICEDIRAALRKDDVPRAKELYGVLHHFLTEHPEAARGAEG